MRRATCQIQAVGPAALGTALMIVLLAALLLGSGGCDAQDTLPSETRNTTTGMTYVTAFGVVQCADYLSLTLPWDVGVAAWYTVAGQAVPPQTDILKIDMDRLLSMRDRLNQDLAGQQAAKDSCRLQLDLAAQRISRLQAALQAFDLDHALDLLNRLAEAGTRAGRERREAELAAYLEKIDSLSQYPALTALITDKNRLTGKARPLLLQLRNDLQISLETQEIQQLDLQQKIHAIEAELLLLTDKTTIINDICEGRKICGIGSFNSEGVLTSGDRPLLLSQRPDSLTEIAAGSRLAEFAALDSVRLLINVEEQLISGVQEGAEVQISPLYDKSVVWLGTVLSVSDRAEVVNGETVIPVVVITDEPLPDPGYNVVVKIKTGDR